MGTSIDGNLCVCGDPHCTGCDCGMGCAFSPGHAQGTHTLSPLAALIEATAYLLVQGNEERPLCSPDLRRLRATLAFAKQSRCECVDQKQCATPVYHLSCSQEHLFITSLTEFDAAAMTFLVWELARLKNAGDMIPLADETNGLSPFHAYAELRKEIVEKVIPDEHDEEGLLALLSFDTSFLVRRVALNDEETDKEETMVAVLLHRELAEHVEAVLEEQWDTCVGLLSLRHSNVWAACIELLRNS